MCWLNKCSFQHRSIMYNKRSRQDAFFPQRMYNRLKSLVWFEIVHAHTSSSLTMIPVGNLTEHGIYLFSFYYYFPFFSYCIFILKLFTQFMNIFKYLGIYNLLKKIIIYCMFKLSFRERLLWYISRCRVNLT